jgi:integrase
MGKSIERLTAQGVKALSAPGRHSDGGNLFLAIGKNGSKSWAFIYRGRGKTREAGLGSVDRVPLKGARAKAKEGRELLGRGLDPITEWRRPAAASIPTLEAAAKDWLSKKELEWRSSKQKKAARAMLTAGCRPIANTPVNEIGTEEVLACLKPIWTRAPVNGMALRGRIENILDAARARGFIDADRANPARWRGHLSELLAKRPASAVRHHAALAYKSVPAFVADLHIARRTEEGAFCVPAHALEFLILTATRSGEALGAQWSEIDLETCTWTLPPERMKSARGFVVPLSEAAIAIVAEMATIRVNAFVFPGFSKYRPMAGKAFERLLRRLGQSCTTHGFRSAFRDWAGNETRFPREDAEAALAHVVGDSVERAYRRDDALAKRRELMDAWARYVEPVPEGSVIPFKRA